MATARVLQTKKITLNSRCFGSLANFGLRYGPGKRSSNSGITATVFGAQGFIGSYFTSELGACGSRVYAPFRGCELEVRHLKPMFDLGQLGLMPFSTRDEESIAESLKYSDIVINFIGKHYETKHIVPTRREDGTLSRINFSFQEVNVDIPRKLARLAKKAGIKSFIHVSAIAADVNSESEWNRTKALGELAVREEFPEAVIVRVAPVFGPQDRFLNLMAEWVDKLYAFPLVDGGKALVQPVFVQDVAKALKTIVDKSYKYEGKTFELAGPAEYSYKEIVEFIQDVTFIRTRLVSVPPSVARYAGRFIQELISPVVTEDLVIQLQQDILPKGGEGVLTFEELGIEPVSMDKSAFDFLHRYRKGGHFTLVEGYH